MPHKPNDVTDAELQVLEVLWERGPATIREISRVAYPDSTGPKAASVLKLLERLERKQFVGRDRSRAAQTFAPLVERDAFIGGQLRRIAQRLGDNSLAPLLTHLVQSASLSSEERRRLRELLDPPQASVDQEIAGRSDECPQPSSE